MLLEFESGGKDVPGLLRVVKKREEILANNDSDEDEYGEEE